MDLVAVNKDPVLRNNPWGKITLKRANPFEAVGYNDEYMVELQHPILGFKSIFGVCQAGARHPLDGAVGNRPFEVAFMRKAIEKKRAEEQRAMASIQADHRADFRREVKKFMARSVDGKENFLHFLKGQRP